MLAPEIVVVVACSVTPLLIVVMPVQWFAVAVVSPSTNVAVDPAADPVVSAKTSGWSAAIA